MRRNTISGLLVPLLLAGTALIAVPVAAEQPAFCRAAVIAVEDLPERLDLDGCDIVGRTVTGGGMRVTVPPPGHGRLVHAVAATSEVQLGIRTTADGYVEVTASPDTVAVTSAPANDAFGSAEQVSTPSSFEWTRQGDTTGATASEVQDAEADEACGLEPGQGPDHTVWYRYQARHYGKVNVALSSVQPTGAAIDFQVLQQDPPEYGGSLYALRCSSGTDSLYVNEGQVYYVRVGTVGAPAAFQLSWTPPRPATDAFAAAHAKAVPFSTRTPNMRGATLEPGEPNPTCKSTAAGTVWHRANVGSLRRIKVNASWSRVAIYRGTSLGSLTQVACVSSSWGALVVLPGAGPYYVQQWMTSTEDETDLYVTSGEPNPDARPPCDDSSRELITDVGRKPLRWRYNDAKTPKALATTALKAIKQGMSIVTKSSNDCGLPDKVSASHEYLGKTTRGATLCTKGSTDGVNAVEFGKLGTGHLGFACSSERLGRNGTWRITESDIRINAGGRWTLKPDKPTCSSRYDLVGVVAHEAAHAFGIGHAAWGYNGSNQTMAPVSTPCSGALRTLGKGDVRALRALY